MQRALILAVLLSAPITAEGTNGADGSGSTDAPVPAAARRAAGRYTAVTIRTKDDLQLKGSYYEPGGHHSGLAPAAVLLHDAGGERESLAGIAERLQKLGFGVLTLDLRGHGQSRTKDIDWTKMDEDRRAALWALAIRDVEAAARWILKQPGIHATNLNMVGFGAGCALAVRHATRDENVRCVALLSPRSQEYGFDVAADLKELGGLPTLVLAPRDDHSETQRMVEAANSIANPYIELLYCASRNPSVLDDKKTPSRVASWLKGIALPKKGRG